MQAGRFRWHLQIAKTWRRSYAGRNYSRPTQLKRRFALRLRLICSELLFSSYGYLLAAGDTVLGVAKVLLVLGALLPDVELGRPEFGDPVAMPLSELGLPGVPYPLVLVTPFI